MPNNVENTMTVRGTKEEVGKMLDLLKSAASEIDFNKVIPMPAELRDVECGSGVWRTVEGKRVDVPEKERAEWRRKYGADNWYDWSITNWGTKWNAYDVHVSRSRDGSAILSFQTAWSVPQPVIQKLCELFPSLSFSLHVSGEVDEEFDMHFGARTAR